MDKATLKKTNKVELNGQLEDLQAKYDELAARVEDAEAPEIKAEIHSCKPSSSYNPKVVATHDIVVKIGNGSLKIRYLKEETFNAEGKLIESAIVPDKVFMHIYNENDIKAFLHDRETKGEPPKVDLEVWKARTYVIYPVKGAKKIR